MTSTEQMNKVLEQVKSITSKPVTEYLENKERWGEFTFRNVETEIRALYVLLECISNLPLTYLPRPYNEYYSNVNRTSSSYGTKGANDFYSKTGEICSLFNRIESFSVSNAREQGLVVSSKKVATVFLQSVDWRDDIQTSIFRQIDSKDLESAKAEAAARLGGSTNLKKNPLYLYELLCISREREWKLESLDEVVNKICDSSW